MLGDKRLCGLADRVISAGVVAASKRVAPLIASKKVGFALVTTSQDLD